MSFLLNPFESFGGSNLLQSIQGAGVPTTNLQCCLDAGDATSYPGTGQPWFDISGQVNDFQRGTVFSPDAADPTFNGTGGNLSQSEYWSFDGGDIFSLPGSSSWVASFHKNNAALTIMAAYYPGTAANESILADCQSATGFEFYRSNTAPNHLIFQVRNGASNVLTAPSSTANAPSGAWQIVGVSVDEAAGATGGTFFANGSTDVFNATYTSPSSSFAAAAPAISSSGGNSTTNAFGSTARLAWLAVWDVALTAAQMQAIYTQTRLRFNL